MDNVKPDLIVVFRKFNDNGEIIAMFPQIIETYDNRIMCYVHNGQHGSSSYPLSDITTLAKPEEYKDLLNELKMIGYGIDENIVIRKKYNKDKDKWFNYWNKR